MTHTHHRVGDRKSLEKDYVLFTLIERTLNREQKGKLTPGFKKALEICEKYNPVLLSTDLKDIRDQRSADSRKPDQILLPDGARFRARWIKGCKGGEFHGMVDSTKDILSIENPQRFCSVVYDNKESMMKALADLREADLGQSVVISAIFDDVFDACDEIGIHPHTVNMSAGIWGRTDLLPEKEILEITTMCGHGYVSQHLVKHLINRVKKREMTPTEAAIEMSKQCICNFFNPIRTANLIEKYLASKG